MEGGGGGAMGYMMKEAVFTFTYTQQVMSTS